jgi:transposase
MSYYSEEKRGNRKYLYFCTAYRNEQGKSRTRKELVGKWDDSSKEFIPAGKYRNITDDQASFRNTQKTFTELEIKNSTIKDYGLFYFLTSLTDKIGLSETLKTAIPEYWKEALTLSCYLICEEDPLMYCKYWINDTETFDVGQMSSQRVSEIMQNIDESMRMAFFEKWHSLRSEKECFAIDITSISSWPDLLDDVEWGKNRDNEKLPQINVCMLMGHESKLPLFQVVYSGSLNDVATLGSTLKMLMRFNKNAHPFFLVMDKGFYSAKNIDDMLDTGFKFIIPASFSTKFASSLIESEIKTIDSPYNTIVLGKNTMFCVSRNIKWNEKADLHAHIIMNPIKTCKEKIELYGYVSKLMEIASADPSLSGRECDAYKKDINKYLVISKESSNEGKSIYDIKINLDVLDKELRHKGWLILLSNYVNDGKTCLSIYRSKDVVEKGFLRLKNSIDLGRLRVHGDESMHNKLLIGFISLIILCHIHKVMSDNDMYKEMTLKELLLTLKKHKVQYINGQKIMYPFTKTQKTIFNAFSVKIPM